MKPLTDPTSDPSAATCAAELGEQQLIRLPLPIVEGSKDYRQS